MPCPSVSGSRAQVARPPRGSRGSRQAGRSTAPSRSPPDRVSRRHQRQPAQVSVSIAGAPGLGEHNQRVARRGYPRRRERDGRGDGTEAPGAATRAEQPSTAARYRDHVPSHTRQDRSAHGLGQRDPLSSRTSRVLLARRLRERDAAAEVGKNQENTHHILHGRRRRRGIQSASASCTSELGDGITRSDVDITQRSRAGSSLGPILSTAKGVQRGSRQSSCGTRSSPSMP